MTTNALIVGAGPIGCMAAIRLAELGWSVNVCEAAPDAREGNPSLRRSINLTLCKRGLRTLPRDVYEQVYRRGVACEDRIVHEREGGLVSLPYGVSPDEHLLSIPRTELSALLLEKAEQVGVRFRFDHDCVQVDPIEGIVSFLHGGEVKSYSADLVVGCDGANSVVRHEMARRGARLDIEQKYAAHGYVELMIPARHDGRHCWPPEERTDEQGRRRLVYGLHAWPRMDALLFAQPNVDGSYSLSLFMPLFDKDSAAGDSFESLTTPEAVKDLFLRCFPDVMPHVPDVARDVLSARIGTLRTMTCSPYAFGRTVLLGDAAHAMVPFFGQGVNSGLEDVQLLSECLGEFEDRGVPQAVFTYGERRWPSGHAVSALSHHNFQELKSYTGEREFQARHAIERTIHRRAPEHFEPLLSMVSFSHYSYAEISRRHFAQQKELDELCGGRSVQGREDEIVDAYLARLRIKRTNQVVQSVGLRSLVS